MTPEELQRTMDFIIEHQARFAAAIEQEREERLQQFNQEREERLQLSNQEREERLQQWRRDQPRIAQVEAAVIRLEDNAIRLENNVIRLEDSVIRLEANVIRLTELAEIQSRRFDQHDQDFKLSIKLHEEGQREEGERHRELLVQLNRILERLPGRE